MAKVTAGLIREVREATGAPMQRAKKVLDEVKGDEKKAVEILKKEGFEKMAKRQDRETANGIVSVYKHHNSKVAAVVELLCETDFVAKNEMFIKLGDEVAMQVASMQPKNVKELMKQDFIREPSKTVEDLVKEVITKTGENINIGKIERFEVGK